MGGAPHPVDEVSRVIAQVRLRVEHPFGSIEQHFGYLRTRYRGLARNRAQLFTFFALGSLTRV